MNLYAGSDGRFYTDWQVSWRFESGEWEPCMWDTEEGWELVDSTDGLVWLYPADSDDLPGWAELEPAAHGVAVVDRREERAADDEESHEVEHAVDGD